MKKTTLYKWLVPALALVFSISFSTAVVAAVVSGWWYVLNCIRYGDPFILSGQAATMTERIMGAPLNLSYWTAFLTDTFESYWGKFGLLEISLPRWILLFFAGLFYAIGMIGVITIYRNRSLQQTLNVAKEKSLTRSAKRKCYTGFSCARRSTNPMNVIFCFLRHVVIHNMGHT